MFRRAVDEGVRAALAGEVNASLTAYQLALASFRLPVWAHALINGLAAGGMVLLGHPELAAAFFVGATTFDVVLQTLLGRWLASSPGVADAPGLRRLAWLSATRVSVYTAPTVVMAALGGMAELAFYATQLATLLVMAISASALSRRVFLGLGLPIVAQTIALTVYLFSPTVAAAVLLNLAILFALANQISIGAGRTIASWHAAFLDSLATGRELAQARDQAVRERAAADAAREAARLAERSKSNFLATMSHEIRTPMNGVLGMAQLLRRDETNPAQAERLEVLIESGEYLLSILNDILDVSKIDAGKLEIVAAPEDLRRFLGRLVSFWVPRADEKGVRLELEIAADTPDWVMMDALRLRQVLFNLIGNALKFTDAGSVRIVAEVAGLRGEQVQLRLAVRDTGPGIDPAHLPHLFDRFSQADETEARRFGGTGLGLAIVKQLVELMGGQVSVDSQVGRGSAFLIDLPLDRAASTPRAASAAPWTSAIQPLRILAVDDNPVNLVVLDQLLSSLGHAVTRTTSGAEALAALGEEAFDLVLADIQMPEMTGTEMLQHLRAAPGPNRHAPVIALTADVTSGGRQRYLEQGFTEHSTKPIQLPDLLRAIDRAMTAPPAAAKDQVA